MNIILVAGVRPNFMKIAPIIEAIELKKKEGVCINYQLVHTGQHYDAKMSSTFFVELNIPLPNVNLNCGGGTQAEQTAAIMVRFEAYLLNHKTDLVLVVGDVTSTMACAIVAKKLLIKVAHVEAGIRSGNWEMPEEINRIVTDSITNYFFTTTETANANLIKSGIKQDQIFFVGNTMIDTLLKNLPRFKKPLCYDDEQLKAGNFLIVTIHRPTNVDDAQQLKCLLDEITLNSHGMKIIFPVHPRTRKTIEANQLDYPTIIMLDPLGYLEFNFLVQHAKAVITDSGGITEEATVLGIPCMTLRDYTERPETCTIGTNELLGTNPNSIKPALDKLFAGNWKKGGIPELWDGKTATRIIDCLLHLHR